MKSLWNNSKARRLLKDDLALRVYTSRLLGQESNLVLHGGGNTSVKTKVKMPLGGQEEVLYVKGSGWDLETIEKQGFAPVKMDALLKMAQRKKMSDTEMVRLQRSAMIDPYAPNPSVEAILHAIIPFRFVDHTHADSVVLISNTKKGIEKIKNLYGDRILIIPYVMPGFLLARKVYEMTENIDWSMLDGIILMHHGVFTFSNEAKTSYEQMIKIVSKAERFLSRKKSAVKAKKKCVSLDLLTLACIRQSVARIKGKAVLVRVNTDADSHQFSCRKNVASIATRGPLTPDHVIRTKRIPLIIGGNIEKNIERYVLAYKKYFQKFSNSGHSMLDASPRWAVWLKKGTLCFGSTVKECDIISDITTHTLRAVAQAERLGGWKALPAKDIFDIEYWELEQAKLSKSSSSSLLQGKIALVTGAASGIGKACVEHLVQRGAVVAALDINPSLQKLFDSKNILTLQCDVTKETQLISTINETVKQFGGLDIVISNAGTFPSSERLDHLKERTWKKSLDINLTSHQKLLKACTPYLSAGVDPAIVIIASKNVAAPGPGVAAYSVAKAGLTQLARVAALELASLGVRVNVVHPNQVFDTSIWTKEVLSKRAKSYNMNVEQYKRHNLLKVDITSSDVAQLAVAMAGPLFGKTTGAQIPVDGGNERVI